MTRTMKEEIQQIKLLISTAQTALNEGQFWDSNISTASKSLVEAHKLVDSLLRPDDENPYILTGEELEKACEDRKSGD